MARLSNSSKPRTTIRALAPARARASAPVDAAETSRFLAPPPINEDAIWIGARPLRLPKNSLVVASCGVSEETNKYWDTQRSERRAARHVQRSVRPVRHHVAALLVDGDGLGVGVEDVEVDLVESPIVEGQSRQRGRSHTSQS